MSVMEQLGAWIASAAAPSIFVVLAFGNDALLSKSASDSIAAAIKDVTDNPDRSSWSEGLTQLLSEYFPSRGQPGKFWLNVLALTAASLLCMLAVYCARMPDVIPQLLTPGFMRQFFGNGLVVTLLVNAFAYWQYPQLLSSLVNGKPSINLLWLVLDSFAKALLFIALTCAVYVLFALTLNAFGGSVSAALRSVFVTIREAIAFRNLTGVYIYSFVLSSFPIFLVVIIKLFVLSPRFARIVQRCMFTLSIADKPIRAASLVFFVFAGLFAFALGILANAPLQLMQQ